MRGETRRKERERKTERERERERERVKDFERDRQRKIEYKSFYYIKAKKLFEQSNSLLSVQVVAPGVVMGKGIKIFIS